MSFKEDLNVTEYLYKVSMNKKQRRKIIITSIIFSLVYAYGLNNLFFKLAGINEMIILLIVTILAVLLILSALGVFSEN